MNNFTNSILIDIDDHRTGKIAEVISNKTAIKILGALAENELSEGELGKKLGIKLNTIGYNVKKLKEVGLIEPVKGFLWSVKGRRVFRYRISNKRIVISPRRMIRGVIPAVLISAVLALGIKVFNEERFEKNNLVKKAGEGLIYGSGSSGASKAVEYADSSIAESVGGIVGGSEVWLWFMAGALFGLFVYLGWNYFRGRFK